MMSEEQWSELFELVFVMSLDDKISFYHYLGSMIEGEQESLLKQLGRRLENHLDNKANQKI